VTTALLLAAPNGQEGEVYDVQTGAGPTIRAQVIAGQFNVRTSPVFIEDYLAANGNSIRAATRAALMANPNAGWFIFPAGEWQWTWTGAPAAGVPQLTEADGLKNNQRFTGQSTRLVIDMQGLPSNQRIMFARTQEGDDHADRMVFEGIRFSLINVVTSFSGYAVGLVAASNCAIIDCEADCTLDASVVPPAEGHLRWGFALFGADRGLTLTGGRNNLFSNIKLTFSQIQACAQPRSVDGVVIENIIATSSNDLAVSCVTRDGGSVRNVLVDGVVCEDDGGAGVLLMGNDGNQPGHGCVLVENFVINNVLLTGQRNPDTLFEFGGAILFYGGLTTRNVVISNVTTRLVPNASAQARSIIVTSQDDEISWEGLSISNCELDVVTSNDPLENLFIAGINMKSVKITNVRSKGRRGIAVRNADALVIDNCTTDDGPLTIQGNVRNLDGITVSNSRFKSVTGFNAALVFQSTGGKNFTNVVVSNVICDSNVAGLLTTLGGGTMAMALSNVWNVSGNNPTAETLAGVIRAVNTPGFQFLTTISVVVPALAAGALDYATASLAGTRLATLTTNEGVTCNPQARIAGGGALLNARMQAAGSAELQFLGPTTGGAANFTFSRTAQ
jgi:hypothetical protein